MAIANSKSLRGYAYIAVATFCWGVSASLGRAAFTGRLFQSWGIREIDPLILSQSRITLAFLVILPILILTRGWRRLRMPIADFGQLFLVGVLGVAASNYFYYMAIERTNVATAITVQYTAPIWVLLYMAVKGLQKATSRRVIAVLLALVGIALVIGLFTSSRFHAEPVGVVAALLAAFAFAFYNIGGHSMLARYDHWMVLLYLTLSATIFWNVINPPWRVAAQHYSAGSWAFLLIFSLVSMLAPYSFYIAGLRYLDPTRAVVTSCLEPVFSIVIAALALGELVRPLQAVGILLVLSAIVVVQMPGKGSGEPVLVEPME